MEVRSESEEILCLLKGFKLYFRGFFVEEEASLKYLKEIERY